MADEAAILELGELMVGTRPIALGLQLERTFVDGDVGGGDDLRQLGCPLRLDVDPGQGGAFVLGGSEGGAGDQDAGRHSRYPEHREFPDAEAPWRIAASLASSDAHLGEFLK